MRREILYRRIFEIIPGLLTWTTLVTLVVLAIVRPVWAAIFVITFDLYWAIRVVYLTTLLIFAYRRLEKEKKRDWLKECQGLARINGLEYDNTYHAVLFPVYNEGLDILKSSIEALNNSNYRKDRMIVVLSVEERGGVDPWGSALLLRDRYKRNFCEFLVTQHPDSLTGEVKTKGANATWGAKILKKFLE